MRLFSVLSASAIILASVSAYALDAANTETPTAPEPNVTTMVPEDDTVLVFTGEGVDAERKLFLEAKADVRENVDAGVVKPENIQIAKRDLNKDGTDEIFAFVEDSFYCGTLGCSFAVFEEKDGALKQISPDLVTQKTWAVPGSETNGYLDLVYDLGNGDPKVWVFEEEGHIYAAKGTDTHEIDEKLQEGGNPTTGQ